MKQAVNLEEKYKLKLKYVNNIQTTTSKINNIHDSDNELAEKMTQTLNIYEKNLNFKDKPSFKKWCIFVVDMDVALLNADRNNRIIKTTEA